jgi:hypothetical protein
MSALPLIHIAEPLLEFRFGQKLVYPRDGLFLYGPVDGGRPEVHYGAIGTPAGLARLERWTGMVAGFLPPPPARKGARLMEPQHVAFPGFSAVFNSSWPVKPRTTVATIDGEALAKALRIANRNEAIKAAVDIYVNPLIAAAVLLYLGAPGQLIAGGAGARPDHPISEHSQTCAQGARMHAVYAAKTCASAQYAGPVALHSC